MEHHEAVRELSLRAEGEKSYSHRDLPLKGEGVSGWRLDWHRSSRSALTPQVSAKMTDPTH